MRSLLLRFLAVLAVAAALGLVWLVFARQLSQQVDKISVARVATLSASPFGWNGTWLQFGPPVGPVEPRFVGDLPGWDAQFSGLSLTGPGPNYGSAAAIAVEPAGRLVLSAGGKSFLLGLRADGGIPTPGGGGPDMPAFAAEPGDAVTLTVERSLMAWPTPFSGGFMPGTPSTWSRHVYFHLVWRKASGARLDMLWAGEQGYDGASGWRAPSGFLVRVDIRPAP